MKGTKRWLSCLLVLLMIFSLASQVFADTISPEDARAQREQREWERNYEEWVSAGGHAHQYTGYTVLTEPTCSSYGEAYMYCAICGESKTEVIAKLPHTWGEWEILVEATDHSSGLRVHTCQVCGTVEQEEFDPEGTLRPGDHGDEVEALQHLLVENDILDRHLITRDFDWMTQQAVKEAEKEAGMEQDGVAWPKLMNHLRHDFSRWVYTVLPSYDTIGCKERTCSKCGYVEKVDIGRKLQRGDYGEDVRRLQEKLTELGFSIGKPDGSFGRRTEGAIEVIQGIYKLPMDGIVWPGIWEMLFPDDDLRFERANDQPFRIEGVYLPNWERPVFKNPGLIRVDEDEEQITEDKPDLSVDVELTSSPSVLDYYYFGETITFAVSVTNTGNVPFSAVKLYATFEPGDDYAYYFSEFENLAPGETRTCPWEQNGFWYISEDQKTSTTIITAKGFGSSIEEDVEDSDSATFPVGPNPAHAVLTIDSIQFPANEGIFTGGDEIVFQATITNDGTIPLTHTVLEGAFSNNSGVYQVADIYECIEPGDSKTDSYTYIVMPEFIENVKEIQEKWPIFNPFVSFIVNGKFSFDYNGKELYSKYWDSVTIPKEES